MDYNFCCMLNIGTLKERTDYIFSLDENNYQNQQILFDIAFSHPFRILRLCAVYKLNKLLNKELLIESYGAKGYFCNRFGGNFVERRLSVVPYITNEIILKYMLRYEKDEEIIRELCLRISSLIDIIDILNSTDDEDVKSAINYWVTYRTSKGIFKHGLVLDNIEINDKQFLPFLNPDFKSLNDEVDRVKNIFKDQLTLKDIDIMIYLIIELEDLELYGLLKSYYNEGFKFKNHLKKYNGLIITPALLKDTEGNPKDAIKIEW